MHKEIVMIAAFAYWFAAESGIPMYIKNVLFRFGVKKKIGYSKIIGTNDTSNPIFVPIRLYPIDCEKCLAFWTGVVWFWSLPVTELILYAGVCSLGSIVIKTLIAKLR